MRHLKSINEEFNIDIVDYIKMSFGDILDDNLESDFNIHGSGRYFKVTIKLARPDIKGNPYVGTYDTSLDRLLDQTKTLRDLYLDTEVALKRIKDEYKDITYTIKSDIKGSIHLNFDMSNLIPSRFFI